MEVIFQHQLTHHRFISGAIVRTRRKWKRNQSWFPVEQNRQFSHMDRIYKETREKYGDDLFKELAKEKRLNSRIYSVLEMPNNVRHSVDLLDMSYLQNLKKIETTNQIYGRLPQYMYEVCDRAQRLRQK